MNSGAPSFLATWNGCRDSPHIHEMKVHGLGVAREVEDARHFPRCTPHDFRRFRLVRPAELQIAVDRVLGLIGSELLEERPSSAKVSFRVRSQTRTALRSSGFSILGGTLVTERP